MNNLKFRAWGAKNPSESNEKIMFTDIEIGKPFTDLNDFFRDRDLIFMQSTGLFDMNGKEIFTGDIVSYSIHDCSNKLQIKCVGYIVYSTYGILQIKKTYQEKETSKTMYIPSINRTTVIGNIYENPELIIQNQ